MTYYDAYLNNLSYGDESSVTVPIKAGPDNIEILFEWDTVAQEQNDEYNKLVASLAASDPLVENSSINRNYNYVEYYMGIGDNIEEWLDKNPPLPSSLQNKDRDEIIPIIETRVEACQYLSEIIQLYEDMLYWNIALKFPSGETVIGKLLLGSILISTDRKYQVEISSINNRDIGRNDLQFTVVSIGVEDE